MMLYEVLSEFPQLVLPLLCKYLRQCDVTASRQDDGVTVSHNYRTINQYKINVPYEEINIGCIMV